MIIIFIGGFDLKK